MAAVLASHCCFCRHIEPSDLRKAGHDLSFTGSVSNMKHAKLETFQSSLWVTKEELRFVAEVHPVESDKLGSNGRVIKMVPTNEVMKSKHVAPQRMNSGNGSMASVNRSKVATNGSNVAVDGSSKVAVNSSKVAINGTQLVKKDGTSALVKIHKTTFEGLPYTEELKVLPSDEGFSWAKDDYNSWQRTVDIWSFVLSLRMRILFDNAKWTYPGGFTEEKQVKFVN